MTKVAKPTNRFTIHVPVKADAVGIGVAQLQSWHETYPNEAFDITDVWIDKMLGFLVEHNGIAFREKQIAEANKEGSDILYLVVKDSQNKIVGFLHTNRAKPMSYIDALYLLESAQGSGIANELMTAALQFIGALPIEVEVASYNARAIHFYKKHGFVEVPDSQLVYKGKVPIIKLIRPVYLIRRPELEDIQNIVSMHAQSWLDTYPNDDAGITKEEIAKQTYHRILSDSALARRRGYLEAYLKAPDTDTFYRLACSGPRIIGLIVATKTQTAQELNALYVTKMFQGGGVAQLLFDEFTQWSAADKPTDLDVVAYNQRAIRFYEKQGFKKIVGSEYIHESGMPSIRMLKEPTS